MENVYDTSANALGAQPPAQAAAPSSEGAATPAAGAPSADAQAAQPGAGAPLAQGAPATPPPPAQTTTAATPPEAKKPDTPQGFGKRVLNSILGALGGTEEVQYERTPDGKLVATAAKSGPGQQFKRIIAGALTGAAAGAGEHGPGSMGRAAAKGFNAGRGMVQDVDDKKRAMADDDFNQQQTTLLRKANIAHMAATTAQIGFENQRLKLGIDKETAANFSTVEKVLAENGQAEKLGTYKTWDEFMGQAGSLHDRIAKDMPHGLIQPFINSDGSVTAVAMPADWDKVKTSNPTTMNRYVGMDKDGKPQYRSETYPAGTSQGDLRAILDKDYERKAKDDKDIFDKNAKQKQTETTANATVKAANVRAGATVEAAHVAANSREKVANTKSQSAKQLGLTAATRTMQETAPKVINLANKVKALLDKVGDDLGPIDGRFSDFMAGKVGTENPDYIALKTDAGLLTTALMRMHVGARGGSQIMEHFKNMVNVGYQSPANLRAALEEITSYAEDVQGMGTDGGHSTASTNPATSGAPAGATDEVYAADGKTLIGHVVNKQYVPLKK
jgi:hypothetical protein